MYAEKNHPLSEELFRNPTREYRGAPFWAWNGKLNKETLEEQILTLKKMGFGGFHIHSRIGLETEYLGEEFQALVKHCHDFGDENDMLTWLYDEDKWPSGVGGGRVTCDKQYANRYLLLSPTFYPDGPLKRNIPQTSRLSKNGDISLMHRYSITLEDGKLADYRMLEEGEEAENIWYAYLVVTENLRWFNNQPYVDTFNAKAIERFIEVTHEPYYELLGDKFSKTVPAIFTDEPSYHKQELIVDSSIPQEVGIAYTEAMEDFFLHRYGHSLLESLPEVLWQRKDGLLSQTRYEYHDCCAELFAVNFSKTLGDWCDNHNILLTGHLLFEDKLDTQSRVIGEAMRSLRYFSLPGIDMLADRHEYTTAKQAQSIARQYDRAGVMSELYGVTNWDYDFRGHKHQGDWQAALGVTVRVHHLAWMTMGGESKRDYPSPIDNHATWYEKYPLIENYFSRLNTVLTRGKAHCRIAMVHPVESYWMHMGPDSDTAVRRSTLDKHFLDATEWLLFNLLDFDYVSEALLPEQYTASADTSLHLGSMAYDVIILPDMTTIRSTTLHALNAFAARGGKVIFLGEIPSYVDGKPSDEPKELAAKCCTIGFDSAALLQELENYRDLDITGPNFLRSERLIHQMRQDGDDRWLFIAQGKHDNRMEHNHWFTQTGREDFTIRVRGTFQAQCFDAMTGEIRDIPAAHRNGWTLVPFGSYAHDSLLLRLRPTTVLCATLPESTVPALISEQYLSHIVDYTLEEPNVLMLDQAEYRLDGGTWMPKEEMLLLDNNIRNLCGYGLRTESFPQPWLEPLKPIEHTLELRMRVQSEVALDTVDFAFEGGNGVELVWNGKPVARTYDRHFVDKAIQVETLGAVCVGENLLEMKIPFGPGVNVEWCYLLGDFGVHVAGAAAVLTAKPEKLSFGDLTMQGMPFYGGVVHYHTTFTSDGSNVELEIPEYKGALVSVKLDDREQDVFAEPYKVLFTDVAAGEHNLTITLYGSRINTFGQVHNCNRKEEYYGPKTWRTSGKNWSYVYQLRQTGVLVTPIVRCFR